MIGKLVLLQIRILISCLQYITTSPSPSSCSLGCSSRYWHRRIGNDVPLLAPTYTSPTSYLCIAREIFRGGLSLHTFPGTSEVYLAHRDVWLEVSTWESVDFETSSKMLQPQSDRSQISNLKTSVEGKLQLSSSIDCRNAVLVGESIDSLKPRALSLDNLHLLAPCLSSRCVQCIDSG